MLHRRFFRILVGACFVMVAWLPACAQPAPSPSQPTAEGQSATRPPASVNGSDETDDSTLLAPEPFLSETTGISFRPPLGSKNSGDNSGQLVVSYTDDARKWVLRVTEATFPNPVQLRTIKDANQQPVQGLLDYTIAQLKDGAPGGQIERSDVINVGVYDVGMIAMRYVQNGQTWLRQQALLEVNDQLYYVFNFVTPGGAEAEEKAAVDTFSALIDTIKVLDRSQIKEDQNQRLFRTRSLFLYWTKAEFASILVPKQYFRILKNGKDIGYTFQEELMDRPELVDITNPGVIAYERTRTMETDSAGTERQTDAGIFQYMSYDRDFERWTRSVVLHVKPAKGPEEHTYATEIGNSSRETKLAFSKEIGVPDPNDPHGPATRPYEVYQLSVTITGRDESPQPVHKDLPPFYLPQAAWHFLPRLVVGKALPQNDRGYLFAVYANDKRELMMLYVDVSPEQDVVFDGHEVHAVVVSERLGLQGNPVLFYVTPDGKYLGSEDRKQHLVTIPSTEQEIMGIWPRADLSRPQQLKSGGTAPQPDNRQ